MYNRQKDLDPERKDERKALELLGNPHKDLKFIHVTGTNGKGSTTFKSASILMEAGFKVGLFCSPHTYSFRERIQINGQLIEMEAIEKYLVEVDELFEKEGLSESMLTV